MKNNLVTQDKQESWDAIKAAHHLSYSTENLTEYYNTWARNYDLDVSNEEYTGPEFITDYLIRILRDQSKAQPINYDLNIIDAGCGTGLVGFALNRKGFRNVDGFDLSPIMVEKAQKTQAYRSLEAECDLTCKIAAYQDNQYDASICCGVFTLGHVPPTALEELIRITKPGGLIIVSTRKSYYDSTDYQAVCDRLQAEGKFSLIDSVMDGPYIAEEGAHYWAFLVN